MYSFFSTSQKWDCDLRFHVVGSADATATVSSWVREGSRSHTLVDEPLKL